MRVDAQHHPVARLGHQTLFFRSLLVVAGLRYHTATGPLPATREIQSHTSRKHVGVPAGIAGAHS